MENENFNTNNAERYDSYIENLYQTKNTLRRKDFIERTGWRDFVPVVDDDAARFLQLVLQLKKPLSILEIGTSLGFSTTSMALTAKRYGGKIITIEFDQNVADQAQKNFCQAGVDDVIQIVQGDAKKIVPGFADESFDMIFQDVDKRLYPVLLNNYIRILKTGGVLIGDDALFPVMQLEEKWADQIAPMQEFNQRIAASARLDSTLIPVGDGMMVAVKK